MAPVRCCLGAAYNHGDAMGWLLEGREHHKAECEPTTEGSICVQLKKKGGKTPFKSPRHSNKLFFFLQHNVGIRTSSIHNFIRISCTGGKWLNYGFYGPIRANRTSLTGSANVNFAFNAGPNSPNSVVLT